MPAFLDDMKRILEVLFVYALKVFVMRFISRELFEPSSVLSPIHSRNLYLYTE